ncbi:MAG TPA: hypothetical protein VLB89_07950 [Gaiellaceae bacterium]|nr:hypothetical protein [Gaiellaceae bacterium]
MRLRQLILALVALAGISVGVGVQHQTRHGHQAAAFTAGPAPRDFPAPPKPRLIRVPALKRPVSATPIAVHVTPKPSVPAPGRRAARPLHTRLVHTRVRPARHTPTVVAAPAGDSRSSAETPPPPQDPLQITNVQVSALTSSSAQITWETNIPTLEQTAFGLDAPTVWTQPSSAVRIDHVSDISGLEYSTTYTAYLHAVDEWNRAQTATITFTTGPMLDQSSARTNGSSIYVDDRPFFPTAVWEQCSDMFDSNINDGINLFMGDGCKDDTGLPARLAGRAYSIVDSEHANATGRGVIGWYFPDEWDAFLSSDVKRSDLAQDIPAARPGRISFLTLTNHFYSKAAPLPQGKGMYPVLFQIPDVIGFDLYPLQVWCRPAFGDVFDAQAELHSLSGGKPTFQWIEVARMEQPCRTHSELDPTPSTVRAETWLSIAGGANAVGYFPNHWSPAIGGEIARTNRQIKALTQALLAPTAPATSDNGTVRVAAHSLNGALYVIAVNTSSTTVTARINVDEINGRSATVFGGSGSAVAADDKGFSDTFGPLDARVYLIPPSGW